MKSRHTPSMTMTPGELEMITPIIGRLLCSNASPFTHTGTCTYIIGKRAAIVIDPGPDDPQHLDKLMLALQGRPVQAILVSHTHKDHSPLARRLQGEVGGDICAFGPHRPAHPERYTHVDGYTGSGDMDFMPDHRLTDGDDIYFDGGRLRVIHTPGHAANHLCFAIDNSPWLFSGDHVMGWSSTVVAPPDGSMSDYMQSLQKLIDLPYSQYLPGHGDIIDDARIYTRNLLAHRKQKEAAIFNAVDQGADTVTMIVDRLYKTLPDTLKNAAKFTVLAHLERLSDIGKIHMNPCLSVTSRYTTTA